MSPPQERTGPTASAELVARIRHGEPRAEEELVEWSGRVVRLILRQMLRGQPEAEDLFQDTFLLVFEKIRSGEIREPEKLSGYIAGLARNLAINHFRREKRRRTDRDSETVERIARAEPPQLGRMLAGERSAVVRQLIDELPTDRDRQVLTRFYIAGEEKLEICDDLGIDSLHFNRVLHRARQRLKQLYTGRNPWSTAPSSTAPSSTTTSWSATSSDG